MTGALFLRHFNLILLFFRKYFDFFSKFALHSADSHSIIWLYYKQVFNVGKLAKALALLMFRLNTNKKERVIE